MYSIKYQFPGPGGDCSASKGPVNPIPGAPGAGCYGHHHSGSGIHGQHRRHTTAQVAPQVESDHKDPSGYPKLPKARRLGRVPTGPSSGAPCPYPYDASPECHSRTPYEPQIVRELLLKGSGIKAVFSLALLPRSVAIHEGVLMQCGRRRRLLKPPVFPGRLTEVRSTEGRHPNASASANR